MQVQALTGGFAKPAHEAARAFRAIMEAMARPGTIHEVTGATPPEGVSLAAGVALLVLADADTGVHLAGAADTPAMRQWLGFHAGAPLVAAEAADFALGRLADLAPLSRFRIGTAEYPDRSATLILEVDRLENDGARLTGPGIEAEARLSLPDLAVFRENRTRWPLGFDVILTCGARLAALPRSTKLEAG